VQLVAGLDVTESSVTAWAADVEGRVHAEAVRSLPSLRSAPHRVELDPTVWEATCRGALSAVGDALPQTDWLGLTVSTLRQGFVLLDRAGEVLGNGVLKSDRRGGPHADVLSGTHRLTGHWPAPELTLPKLLAVRAEEPERWAATERVLFLHDWLVARMTGVHATEASYACAGGMADVARRTWAADLLADNGIHASLLAPVVEAGAVVGELREGWGLPATLPVVAGCGDTQLAAMGAGGLGDGVLTVVAGSWTPVQAATATPVADPLVRPWVSTHAARDLWAAEGNAGSPGAFSGWWEGLVVGSGETHEHALLQGHAFAIRGDVADLERALGRPAAAVVVCGGAAADGRLPALLAEVLGRDVHSAGGSSPRAAAGAVLVARAIGAHAHVPGLPSAVLPAGDKQRWDARYEQWRAAQAAG
jgi:sugar (pentulose or hexulose) kinase